MNPHFNDLSRSSSHLHNQVENARWSESSEKCDQTKTKEYNIIIVIDLWTKNFIMLDVPEISVSRKMLFLTNFRKN